MAWEKFRQQQPGQWATERQYVMKPSDTGQGDGNGGFGWRPGQYITKRETAESESGLPVKQANILAASIFLMQIPIAVLIVFAYLAIGPIIILLFVETVDFAAGVLWWTWRKKQAETGGLETFEVRDILLTCGAIALVAPFLWTIPLDLMSWQFRTLAVGGIAFAYFSIPLWVSRATLSWRMFVEVVDDSYPNPRAAIAYPRPIYPWTKADEVRDWSTVSEELPLPDTSLDTFRAVLQEALADKKPVVKLDTILVTGVKNRNGNPLHLNPDPGEIVPQNGVTDVIMREKDERERVFLYVQRGQEKSTKVPMDVARHFVRSAQSCGSTFRDWRERGVSDEKQNTIRKVLELAGIITLGDGDKREEITWNVEDGLAALAEFDRMFYPPTPSNETV